VCGSALALRGFCVPVLVRIFIDFLIVFNSI